MPRLLTSVLPPDTEALIERVIGCAIEIHRTLGPVSLSGVTWTPSSLDPIFQARLILYLKTSGCRAELLINFNARLLKEGLKRIAW